MSVFTTRRERQLWAWALIVLAAIYATLWPAEALARALRERNLLELSLTLFVLLVAAAVLRQWFLRRPSAAEVAVTLSVAAVYWLVWVRIGVPEERTHLVEYGLLAILIHQALAERQRHQRRLPAPAILAVIVTALLGWLDEGIQALLPNRYYDWRDVGFNALAASMAIAASVLVARVRPRAPGGPPGG